MANELVLVSSRDDVWEGKHDKPDTLGIELEAMSTIGRTLDAIEDPALRRRILNWVMQRWGVERSRTDTVEGTARSLSIDPANDPALSVDSIGDLFADSPAGVRPANAVDVHIPSKPMGKAPVESMLQSLAADFQRLADEWNGDADANT
jgi:hypothetical protein